MRFENMLAKRYIFTQKRHSLLTIFSIIAAVAMMTMIFCSVTTVNTIRRESYFDRKPYHVLITPATEKQISELRAIDGVKSVEVVKSGNTTEARVMFRKYLKDFDGAAQKVIKIAGLRSEIDTNDQLILLDLVSDDAKYNFLRTVALLSIFVIIVAMILRLIIDTAFEVSSKERERQFGMLQSIGASPKQIVRIITSEGCMLSLIGVPLGVGVGVLLAYAGFRVVLTTGIADAFFTQAKAEQLVRFHVMPLMLIIPAVIGFAWVMFSAYGTGMRVIKMSPVDAISARSKKVNKVRRRSLYGLLFGWTGKLAARNNRRQPKRFIITVLSLTLSITLFASLGFITKFVRDSINEMLKIYDIYGKSDDSDDFLLLYPTDLDDPTASKKYLTLLEESGLFKNIYWHETVPVQRSDSEDKNYYSIHYISRDYYNSIFGSVTDITYDELTADGGYILLNSDGTDEINAGETIDIKVEKLVLLSDEEYEEAKNDKSRKLIQVDNAFSEFSTEPDSMYNDAEEESIDHSEYNAERIKVPEAVTISAVLPYSEVIHDSSAPEKENFYMLFATYDTYISRDCYYYGNISECKFFRCDLADESSYYSAMMFLRSNSDSLRMAVNNFKFKSVINTTLSAMDIGITFVSVLIIVIAIVNMINIITTGLLNRRRELAAMQCIGMTRRQMNKLTVIESLQYSLIAAVASTVICELMLLGTKMLMRSLVGDNSMDKSIVAYSQPLPVIWISAAVVFAIALIASFAEMQRMNKTPLIDQLRMPE